MNDTDRIPRIQKVHPDPDFQFTVSMMLRRSVGGIGMHSTE